MKVRGAILSEILSCDGLRLRQMKVEVGLERESGGVVSIPPRSARAQWTVVRGRRFAPLPTEIADGGRGPPGPSASAVHAQPVTAAVTRPLAVNFYGTLCPDRIIAVVF